MNDNILYVWCEHFKSEDLTKLLRGKNTQNPLKIIESRGRLGHLDLAELSNPSILRTRIDNTPTHNYNNTHFVLGEVCVDITIPESNPAPAIKIDIKGNGTLHKYALVADKKSSVFEEGRERIVVPITRHPILDFVDAYESLPQLKGTTPIFSTTPERAERLSLL